MIEPGDLGAQLVSLSATIRDGRAAIAHRARMIQAASVAGWTQQRIADTCQISQAAVSKILASRQSREP